MIDYSQWEALKTACARDADDVPLATGDLDKLVRQYENFKSQDRAAGNKDRDAAVQARSDLAQQIVVQCTELFTSIGGLKSAYAPALTVLRLTAEDTLSRLSFELDAIEKGGRALHKKVRPEALDPSHRRWYAGVQFARYQEFRKAWKAQLLDTASPERMISTFYTWLQADDSRCELADEWGETLYLDEERRQRKRILIQNGIVKRPDKAKRWMPYSSTGESIFVMLTDRNIYTSKTDWKNASDKPAKAEVKHHSGLAGGQTILAAGSWVVTDGKITKITQQSGHYHPRLREMLTLLSELNERGVDLNAVELLVYKYSKDPRCETPDNSGLLPKIWKVPDGAGAFLRSDGLFAKQPGVEEPSVAQVPSKPAAADHYTAQKR